MILFTVLLRTAKLLRETHSGRATTGGSGTFVDSHLGEPAGVYDDGTIFFLSGSNRLLSSSIVSQSANGTFIFDSLGHDVAVGDRYTISSPNFPKDDLIEAVNAALLELSPVANFEILVVDDEDAEGLESYVLPGYWDVCKVEKSDETEEPYNWQVLQNWSNVGNTLTFDTPITSARLRIWYMGEHGYVYLDADEINNDLHPMLVAWMAAYYLLEQRITKTENNEPGSINSLTQAKEKIAELKARYPVTQIPKTPKLASY